jgi:sigma-E factor negative regulatory protein RseA
MTDINEKLSSLIDNENVERKSLDALIHDQEQQKVFSRYQLIGDVMRNEAVLNIDISDQIMAEIAKEQDLATVTQIIEDPVELKTNNNVIPFMKRFGQYAIAASVAGVVVMTSFLTSQPATENNSGIEVLNTIPFGGGASPVSLQTNKEQTKQALQERHERLEALLKDHQLQLQIQP